MLRDRLRVTMVAHSMRGGTRSGAGRKRLERYGYVPHLSRIAEAGGLPVHVTARAVCGLPSFRDHRIGSLVLLQTRRLNDQSFQVVHHSVQTNHLHLLVEAADATTLSHKMSGFMVSFARRLNAELGRNGRVWSDRFFARDITDARDMHNTLTYVFGNAKKHGVIPRDSTELDPFSSAWTFDGWDQPVALPAEKFQWVPPKPRTELLRRDWIAHGLLRVDGAPRSSRTPS